MTKAPEPLPPLTDNPTPDAARAWRVFSLIEQHRDSLDMGSWIDRRSRLSGENVFPVGIVGLDDLTTDCSTTACQAGWTVAEAGYTMLNVFGFTIVREVAEAQPGGIEGLTHSDVAALDRCSFSVMRVAQRLLGLGDIDADRLFTQTSDDELEDALTAIFGPRPEVIA